MLRNLACVIALSLLSSSVAAQVSDGSLWAFPDGTTAAASVGPDDEGDWTLTVIGADGFSEVPAPAWGLPAIQDSLVTTTQGGTAYKAKDGKLMKKVNGKWIKGRKAKKPPVKPPSRKAKRSPGSQVVAAPPSGPISPWPFSSPGEEVTSLPDPGNWMTKH